MKALGELGDGATDLEHDTSILYAIARKVTCASMLCLHSRASRSAGRENQVTESQALDSFRFALHAPQLTSKAAQKRRLYNWLSQIRIFGGSVECFGMADIY